MKSNVLNSPGLLELKKRRRKSVLIKFLILFFGFLVIFLFLAYLSRLSKLNISEVEILGNKILDTETLKVTVEQQITGKYLWLFPKTNIFLYPKNIIKNKLQTEFKRIKDISLTIKNTKTLEVSLIEREAKYTWCGIGVPTFGAEEKCYFVDEDGYVFDEAPYFSGNVYFKFYGTQTESYFSKQNFKQLVAFKDILINLGLKPIALYATGDGDIQVFLSGGNSLSMPPKIILKADADFQNIAENLQAALNTEPLKSKFKNKYSNLQYIDLRFGNKVYDKFQ